MPCCFCPKAPKSFGSLRTKNNAAESKERKKKKKKEEEEKKERRYRRRKEGGSLSLVSIPRSSDIRAAWPQTCTFIPGALQ